MGETENRNNEESTSGQQTDMATSTTTIDRERAEKLLDALDGLDFGGEGRVHLLVETPQPHRHATREAVRAVPGRGFAGDHPRKSFYKGRFVPGREVSAMAVEVLRVFDVDPVVIGDNLITEGVDLRALEPGDRLQVGEEVVLERSNRPHRPCVAFRERTSPEAFAAVSQGDCRGALFVVRTPGTIRRGDVIRRLPKG